MPQQFVLGVASALHMPAEMSIEAESAEPSGELHVESAADPAVTAFPLMVSGPVTVSAEPTVRIARAAPFRSIPTC
jgi:hypothetical protein